MEGSNGISCIHCISPQSAKPDSSLRKNTPDEAQVVMLPTVKPATRALVGHLRKKLRLPFKRMGPFLQRLLSVL